MIKWIRLSPNHYKTVDEDDPRPAVKLKSRKGAPNIRFTPSWKVYEEGMLHQLSPNQEEYTDKFIAERDHQTKTDPIAKRWEESRKARVVKDKPAWRKEMMRKGVI